MRDFTGCPNCQSVDPARCHCSPYDRLMVKHRLVQRENMALRQELASRQAHMDRLLFAAKGCSCAYCGEYMSAVAPPAAREAGHEL